MTPSRAMSLGPSALGVSKLSLTSAAFPGDKGVPRGQLAVDVMTLKGQEGGFTDELPLESVRDARSKLFLARYRIATQLVSGHQQYQAWLRQDGRDWIFEVHLERFAADSVRSAFPDAQPLDAVTHVSLTYAVELATGTMQRSVEFQSVVSKPEGLVATLRLSSAPDQDDLYEALSSRASRARLILSRKLRVGVPVQLQSAELVRLTEELRMLKASPVMWLRTGMGGYLSADGGNNTPEQAAFLVENLSGHDRLMTGDKIRLRRGEQTAMAGISGGPMRVAPLVNPPPPEQQILIRKIVGGSDRGPRYASEGPIRVGDTFSISFYAMPGDSYMSQSQWTWSFESPPPDDPASVMRSRLISDTLEQIVHLSKSYSTDRFEISEVELPWAAQPDPLFLSDRLHPYVYRQVTPSGAMVTGLVRLQVNGSSYYQEQARPQRFYYLPDRFELASVPGRTVPNLTIRATPDVDTYLVQYVAAPVVDPARLKRDADAQLLSEASRLAGQPVAQAEFEPLLGDMISVSVATPGPGGWQSQVRPNVLASLHDTFSDVLTLQAQTLQYFYDALFSADATPFRGLITVKLGDEQNAWAQEQVPFVGRVRGLSRDELWAAVFDPEVPATFLRRVEIVAAPSLFESTQKITVNFELGGVVILTPDMPRGATDVGQPIGDYILRKPDAGAYRYRLIAEGVNSSDWRVGQGSTLNLRSL